MLVGRPVPQKEKKPKCTVGNVYSCIPYQAAFPLWTCRVVLFWSSQFSHLHQPSPAALNEAPTPPPPPPKISQCMRGGSLAAQLNVLIVDTDLARESSLSVWALSSRLHRLTIRNLQRLFVFLQSLLSTHRPPILPLNTQSNLGTSSGPAGDGTDTDQAHRICLPRTP